MANSKFKVLFMYPNLMCQTKFPMGIAILASILKQNGFDVSGFDTTFYITDDYAPHEYQIKNLQLQPLSDEFEQAMEQRLHPYEEMIPDFQAKVMGYQPDLIAVSSVEDTFRMAVDLLESVSEHRIPNIVGGVFPTFAPAKAIREKAVDMICIGEGEGPLLDLCQALSKNEDYTRIPNLWVKKSDGEVVRNSMRSVIDLDTLPQPNFDLFDNNAFYFTSKAQSKLMRSGSVETARGCPYKCSFCNSPSQVRLYNKSTNEQFFRLKSVENVFKELRYLKDVMKVGYIYFPADTFLAIPDSYLHQLAEMYQDIDLPFWCQTRPETLTEERLGILDKMGCQNVSIGLEHGNREFRRDVVRRNYTNEEFLRRMRLIANTSERMKFTINAIVGFPTETRELTWDTIRLVKKIHELLHQINAFHFTPYHGTQLREVALNKGYIDDDEPVHHNFKDTILDMPEYPADQIRGIVRTFTMYVKFPEDRYPQIQRAERMDESGDREFRELRKEYIASHFESPDDRELHSNLSFSEN